MNELAEVKQKNKDYKELIRTLQKEAEKANTKLSDTEAELKTAVALEKTGYSSYMKEKELTSKLMNEVATLQRKNNTSEQKAVLWANQYFEFMQKAIDQSATAMTTPPQTLSSMDAGGIKK